MFQIYHLQDAPKGHELFNRPASLSTLVVAGVCVRDQPIDSRGRCLTGQLLLKHPKRHVGSLESPVDSGISGF